jgi:uncharacterized membrane protein YkvA (DUF1232 family)
MNQNYNKFLRNFGWWRRGLIEVRLCWRLLWERRVAFHLKLIPVLAIVYFFSPYDLLPDFIIPGIGQLDDFLVIFLACRLFLRLVPVEIVREHFDAL